MKKMILAMTLAAVVPLAAYAAVDGPSRHDRGARMERMAERLNLDESQKTRMEALFKEHKAERQALREQMQAQIREILNEEQFAKMQEHREKRREHRKERRERHKNHDCAPKSES